MSIDGLRQGDGLSIVFFNILASRIYKRQLATLNRRGILYAIADYVKIAAPLPPPPSVIAEIVDSFDEVAWTEKGLTTQVVKNRIFVQPSARNGWSELLQTVPRDSSVALIPSRHLSDPQDLDSARLWHAEDGFNVLGTSLGTPDYIKAYLFVKGVKHRQVLTFNNEVDAAYFPREAVAMLTGVAGSRLTHLLKSVPKTSKTEPWMRDMDSANVST
jgi:hypothetical protein